MPAFAGMTIFSGFFVIAREAKQSSVSTDWIASSLRSSQ
jgi:hypothetical protein